MVVNVKKFLRDAMKKREHETPKSKCTMNCGAVFHMTGHRHRPGCPARDTGPSCPTCGAPNPDLHPSPRAPCPDAYHQAKARKLAAFKVGWEAGAQCQEQPDDALYEDAELLRACQHGHGRGKEARILACMGYCERIQYDAMMSHVTAPVDHDHPDCPCGHPLGTRGPCGGCNCVDPD